MSKGIVLGTKAFDGNGYKNAKIVVIGGLNYISGNDSPYFSLVADIYEGKRDVGGGACHDLIVSLFPEFKPLADLHLSDLDGVPMHGEANGYYWLAGAVGQVFGSAVDGGFLGQKYCGGNGSSGRSVSECLSFLAKHMRISEADASELVMKVKLAHYGSIGRGNSDGSKAGKAVFHEFFEAQKPRWKAEAEACIDSLGLEFFGDVWNKEAAC